MRTVGEIIRERREALGLTLAALADEVGATKSYLSMIENHRVSKPPSPPLIKALERALRITDGELSRAADWANTPPEVRKQVAALERTAAEGRALAEKLKAAASRRSDGAKNLDKLHRSGELAKLVHATLKPAPSVDAVIPLRYQVPLINKVAAGYPSDFTDLDYPARVADEYIAAPDVSDPQAFAARVVGESMLPDYHEGDIVVFSPAAKVTDGCDCFVRLEPRHETTFKRVFFDNGHVRLQPLNPRFAPSVVPRDQVAGLYKAVLRIQKLG